MKVCRTATCEGVFLNTVTTDRFKTAMLTVHFLVPLRQETASAYSLLTDVLMRGTKHFPTMRLLNRKQDELYSLGLGAYVQNEGETQIVTAELTCIDDAYAFDGMAVLQESMRLLHDFLFCPYTEQGVFCHAYVEQEKEQLICDIRAREHNKSAYAYRRFLERMCEGEPYAVDCGGCPEEIGKLTAELLWHTYVDLMKTARVEIFYVGRQPQETLLKLCRQWLPFAPRDEALPSPSPVRLPGGIRTVREETDGLQSHLFLGFRCPECLDQNRLPPMLLLNEILGGTPNGRLYRTIREKQGLCYDCGSTLHRLKGLLVVEAAVEESNRQQAEQAIWDQMNSLCTAPVPEPELQIARRALMHEYRSITDTPVSICGWYLRQVLTEAQSSPEDMLPALQAVTPKQLLQAARSLQPDTVYCLTGGQANR